MAFTLPDLPYDFDALEPHIDARTMEIHHGKHHAGYTSKLNDAVAGTDMEGMAVEAILRRGAEALPTAVRNNGGGYANHNLFWQILAPGGDRDSRHGDGLSAELEAAGDAAFGNYEGFKKAFSDAAASRFGSGWAWLAVKGGGGLEIYSTPNQDSPYMRGDTPILGLDVWEHAYYLNYQNRRRDYIEAFFKIINWAKVSELYAAAS